MDLERGAARRQGRMAGLIALACVALAATHASGQETGNENASPVRDAAGPLAEAGAAREDAGRDQADTAPDAPPVRRAAPLRVRSTPAPPKDGPPPDVMVSPAPAPPISPAPPASAGPGAPVRLDEHEVFTIRARHGGSSPEQRARAAAHALLRLTEAKNPPAIRFEVRADEAIVFDGQTPILRLYPADAEAAGEPLLSTHAADVTARITDAIRTERRRKALASTVFAVSLLVSSGLIMVVLLRKATLLFERARTWVADNPQRVPALRLMSLDLVGPGAVRAGLAITVGLGRILVQLGIVYAWLLFGLSLFASTRGYGAQLTSFVLTPVSALVGRIGASIPMVGVAAVAALAVIILLRFVSLYFGSLARGETSLSLVPPDLAIVTGVLVRAGIVVVALLLASPLITGSEDGSLSRAGVAALVALGVACAPVLACAAAGVPAVYGRRLRPGDVVELGGRSGTVRAVDLLEIRLVDELGCELRVPHLVSLVHPTRIIGRTPLSALTVIVDPTARQTEVRALLLERARQFGPAARVTLERLDAGGARYRITAPAGVAEDLACAIADTLTQHGIPLGKGPGGGLS